MRTKIALMTSLAALGALVPAAAFAQDTAPAATEPAAPPAPAGEATPVAGPAMPPMTGGDTMGAANPEAAPTPATEAAEGPAPMPGWVRIDSDGGGVQLWGGGTYPITDGVGLAFDMYVLQTAAQSLGELDVGPAITAGPLTLTPMIGLQIDWTSRKAQALVPQFYAVGSLGPIYTELWFQYYLNTVFNKDSDDPAVPPVANDIYVRLIADFKINDYIAAGLELDLNHNSEWLDREGEDAKIKSLAIGPNLMLFNVGAGSSFMAFLGYETTKFYANGGGMPASDDGANHLTGRLTFVHNF